jgi:hypothetical protein
MKTPNVHAVVQHGQLAPGDPVSKVRPISERLAANHDTVSAVLAEEVCCPELPRVHIQVALLEANAQRYTRPPSGVQAKQPTPGEVRLDQTRPVLLKQLSQRLGRAEESVLLKKRPKIKHIQRNSQPADLVSNGPIAE